MAYAGLVTLMVFLAAVVGIAITQQSGRIASIWLANSIVVLALLRTPRRTWAIWLICGLVGTLLGNLAMGNAGWSAFALSLSNSLEILLVSWLFRQWDGYGEIDLTRIPSLAKFVCAGVGLGPAASALTSASWLHVHEGLPFWPTWSNWYSSNALGLLIMVPLLAGRASKEFTRMLRWPIAWEALVYLVAIPALTATLVYLNLLPWLFLLGPVFLWSTLRLGYPGVTMGIFLAAASGIGTLALRAPHPGFAEHLRFSIGFLQLFLATNVLMFVGISNLLRELRESEANLSSILESTQDPIWSVDRSYRLLHFNTSYADHCLRDHGTVVQCGMAGSSQLAPEQASTWPLWFERAAAEGPFTVNHDAQGGRTLELAFNPIRSADAIVGFTVFSRDITERKAAERERLVLQAEIEHMQKMDSLGRFAGGVAHDMNNVLGAIFAVTQTVRSRFGENPELDRAMASTERAAARGRDLVKGLLGFARKDLVATVAIDINQLVHQEMELMDQSLLKKYKLIMDLEEPLPPIQGEFSALGSALMNLCVNAVDAMPKGGTLTIRTRRMQGAGVQIAVEDTGEGMSPEVLKRAVEPFYTTKPVGKGTGLGLATVFSTVRAHGGSVTLNSQEGLGTQILIQLPGLVTAEALKTQT